MWTMHAAGPAVLCSGDKYVGQWALQDQPWQRNMELLQDLLA